jgi:hypothetical protein
MTFPCSDGDKTMRWTKHSAALDQISKIWRGGGVVVAAEVPLLPLPVGTLGSSFKINILSPDGDGMRALMDELISVGGMEKGKNP